MGTTFLVNFEESDLEVDLELTTGVFVRALTFDGNDEVMTATIENTTAENITIAVKGGSDQVGNFLTIAPGGTATISVTDNPTISNLSVCQGPELEDNGTLTLDKVTVNGDDEFAFTLGGTALADTLSGADPAVLLASEIGTYVVAEALTQAQMDAGWSLTSIDCVGNATEEVVTDTSVSVTVGADEDVVCTFTNTLTEDGEEPEETVEVSIMKHLCTDVASVAEFEAIEAAAVGENPDNAFAPLVATVLACPTIVLTGDIPTEGAISGGQVDFEFSVVNASGTQLLSEDGTFMQAALCESDVALDADGDGTIEEDVCLDISHYSFEVIDGVVVITETDAPAGHRFGTIRFTPGSDDADTLVGSIASVEATGVIRLDTTRDEDDTVMVHAYNFVTEGTQEETVAVSIMKHLCTDVTNVEEFEAVENAGVAGLPGGEGTLSGLAATVLACPTIVLTGDVPTSGAVSGGQVDFDFTVVDASGTQVLSSDGDFEAAALCEVDIDVDVNSDGDKGDCLDVSHYMFEVIDGAVVITETEAPAGSSGVGTLRFTPGSEDETALTTSIEAVESTGVIRLDTTRASDTALEDGMIMLHVYNFAIAEGTQGGGGGPRQDEGTKGGTLPNTAMDQTGSLPAVLLSLTMLAGLGAGGYRLAVEARRRR